MTLSELKDQHFLQNLDALYEGYRNISLEEKEREEGLIHFAASVADPYAIKILLEREVDVNEIGKYQNRPLHLLAEDASKKNAEQVKESALLLLDAGASVIRKNMMGETPIFLAARYQSLELIQIFVERGAKLHFTDNNGQSPLHIAVSYFNTKERERSIAILRLLLEGGADPYLKNDSGETAIDIATVRLKDPEVAAILKGEYDFETPNSLENQVSGMSLHAAILAHDYETIKAHIAFGTNVNEISEEENHSSSLSPLGTACYLLDLKAVELLLDAGADVNVKNNLGETAHAKWFQYLGDRYFEFEAAENKTVEKIMKLSIEKGLDINAIVDDRGNSLLIKASEFLARCSIVNGSSIPMQTLKVLLQKKVDVNASNLEGKTALMYLCENARHRDLDLIIDFLERDAEVGALDKQGYTPMMYLAKNREMSITLEIAELLYDFGDIKLSQVNNDGQSAMDIAVSNNNENLVNWILMKL